MNSNTKTPEVFVKLKNKKVSVFLKWIVGILVALFFISFVANTFVTYVMCATMALSDKVDDSTHGYGYSKNLIGNQRQKAIDDWKKYGYYVDPNTGGPNSETIANANNYNAFSNIRHFNVNLLPYGGTSNQISTYIITANNKTTSYLNQWVFLIHGFQSDWTSTLEYGQMFLDQGLNIVIWDNQGVSKNKKDSFGFLGSHGGKTTFGIKEGQDAKAIVKWFENPIIKNPPTDRTQNWLPYVLKNDGKYDLYFDKTNPNNRVWICGISLGGTSAIVFAQSLTEKERTDLYIKGIIADSAFSDLFKEMANVARVEYHIPVFPIKWGFIFWYHVLTGENPYDNSVGKHMSSISSKLPMLFIHTQYDTFVPFTNNFYQLFRACQSEQKMNLVVPGTNHVNTVDYEYFTTHSADKLFNSIFINKWTIFYNESK